MPSQIYPAVYPSASHSADSYYINVSWSFPSGTSVGKVKILDYNTGAEVYNSGLLSRYTSSTSCYISSPQWNIYGLYCVSVQVFNYDTGDFSPWSDTVYGFNRVTMDTTPAPSPPSNISASYSGLNATITWTKGSYANNTAITFNGNTYYTTGNSYTVTLPAKGVYYDINLASINSNSVYSSWVYGGALYVAPAPLPTVPTNVSVSYSGMTATITWTKGNNTSYTDVWNTGDNTHGTPTGNTWAFTVPSKGVNYNFKLASVNSDGVASSWVDVPSIYIAARPSNFYGSLYKTATDGNDVVDTAQWHAFATRINEFRAYKGLTQFSYNYLSNAQNGSDFLAIYFNEMLTSMSFCSGLPSNKSSGNSIYKSYFDTMISSLNNVV
jgi:hypothetical protein